MANTTPRPRELIIESQMMWISRIEFLSLKYVRYSARNASKITPFASKIAKKARTFPIRKVRSFLAILLAFLAELRAVFNRIACSFQNLERKS